VFAFVIISFIISVASSIFSTFWLSKWMNDVHDEKVKIGFFNKMRRDNIFDPYIVTGNF
jgi:hypothetical protein